MQNKRNKLLCIIFTLFIFVYGMYFEELREDMVLCNTFVQKSESCVITDNLNENMEPQMCTVQMLSTRERKGVEKMTPQDTIQRRDMRVSLDFLCQNLFSLKEGKVYSNLEELQSILEKQEKHVTNYIHKSDGKKRI